MFENKITWSCADSEMHSSKTSNESTILQTLEEEYVNEERITRVMFLSSLAKVF